VAITERIVAMGEETLRHDQVKIIPGARHRDIDKSSLGPPSCPNRPGVLFSGFAPGCPLGPASRMSDDHVVQNATGR
jgi:hypothetical protein